MDGFSVNHSGFAEVNDQLQAGARQLQAYLEELNKLLDNTNLAAQGKAAPLWINEQTIWKGTAETMGFDLTRAHGTQVMIANRFMEGDNRGARIFG